MFKDITRGGQTLLHRVRMLKQVFFASFFIGLLVWLIIFGVYIHKKVPTYIWSQAMVYATANMNIKLNDLTGSKKAVKQAIKLPGGKRVTVNAVSIIKHPEYRHNSRFLLYQLKKGSIYSLWFGLLIFLLTIFAWGWQGRQQKKVKHVRGSRLIEPKQLKKILVKKISRPDLDKSAKWTKEQLPFPYKDEVRGMIAVGAPGVGKTNALSEIISQKIAQGNKGIIYDMKGSYVERFYREGKDIILNPLDLRMPNWNIWSECNVPYDYERIATTMMPHHIATTDPFWINAARTIFSVAARKLGDRNCIDTKELLRLIFSSGDGDDQLSSLLRGTEAESLVSQNIKQTAQSIKATLTTYCKSLMYLPAYDTGKPDFSIMEWIKQPDDSWLFISVVDHKQLAAIVPLLSIWVDVVFQGIMSLKRDEDRRVYTFLDELPTLQRLASLEDFLSLGREYGGSVFIGVQNLTKLESIYGKTIAKSIDSNISARLCMKVNGKDEAEQTSQGLFNKEYIEHKEGFSYGANTIRDGVNISEDKRNERLVLPSEIASLNKLEGYLKYPDERPAKVQFNYAQYAKQALDLIPRKIESADFELYFANADLPENNDLDKQELPANNSLIQTKTRKVRCDAGKKRVKKTKAVAKEIKTLNTNKEHSRT